MSPILTKEGQLHLQKIRQHCEALVRSMPAKDLETLYTQAAAYACIGADGCEIAGAFTILGIIESVNRIAVKAVQETN